MVVVALGVVPPRPGAVVARVVPPRPGAMMLCHRRLIPNSSSASARAASAVSVSHCDDLRIGWFTVPLCSWMEGEDGRVSMTSIRETSGAEASRE